MEKIELIETIAKLLLSGEKHKSRTIANIFYPFQRVVPNKRHYTKKQLCTLFLRDGYIDRYSGQKLLFPGLIRILSLELPNVFRYNQNWQLSKTHQIYYNYFPTLDHLVPLSRGGSDSQFNWVTTSMMRNSAKSNWTIEELNWKLYPKGDPDEWNGLINYFIKLINHNQDYLKNKYINDWQKALIYSLNNYHS